MSRKHAGAQNCRRRRRRTRNIVVYVCSVALAAVEHERSRAAATGTSVLCGSLLSCSDGLERESLASVGRVKTQSLEEEEGDGSQKPETVEQAIDGFDLFTFGGEAPDSYEPTKYFARYQVQILKRQRYHHFVWEITSNIP